MTIAFEETDMGAVNPDDAANEALTDSSPIDEPAYRCEACGEGLVYSGRGRHPKLCPKGEGCRANVAPPVARAKGTRNKTGWQAPLEQALTSNLAGIGLVVYALDQYDGTVIMQGAPRLAQSLVGVAEQNPNVRKALESLVTAGAWSGVVMAAAGIAIPILGHHGYLPGNLAMPVQPQQPTA